MKGGRLRFVYATESPSGPVTDEIACDREIENGVFRKRGPILQGDLHSGPWCLNRSGIEGAVAAIVRISVGVMCRPHSKTPTVPRRAAAHRPNENVPHRQKRGGGARISFPSVASPS